jgi:hypothetical protein
MEPDYAEGLELRAAGDPESARDALRFALQGCGDNMWTHVALAGLRSRIQGRGPGPGALRLRPRPGHARHPAGFDGHLPANRPANRPAYDAIKGLATSFDALGQADAAAEVRALGDRWSGAPRPVRDARIEAAMSGCRPVFRLC